MTPQDLKFINKIIVTEGGYSDHKNDRGGPTNFGVTQRTLSAYRGRPVSVREVKDLTIELARTILYNLYFVKPQYDRFGYPDLRELLADIAINSGPQRANMIFQQALALGTSKPIRIDGLIGPQTMSLYNEVVVQTGVKWLINEMVDLRVMFYGKIVRADPKQAVFLVGWLTRALSYRQVV